MVNIAILASGSGSNAEKIAEYFQGHESVHVSVVMTNNPKAGVIARANRLGVPVYVFGREEFYQSNHVLNELNKHDVQLVVLAGFLWLMPENIIENIRTINIHPALLPSYGGKGMYGMNVHRAVKENKEEYSGITIHDVNAEYDQGEIIFQEKCLLSPHDTPETIQKKVQVLEHRNYPLVIERIAVNP